MKFDQVSQLTEDEAREYLEKIRWPEGAVCPHCRSKEVTKLAGKASRPGVYKCKAKECRKQFTVTVKTIFEKSHVSIRHWVMAFSLMVSSKKGISAHQMHRMLGVTYKTAWFICHRVRHAMTDGIESPKLSGTVETDEVFIGGRQRPFGRRTAGKVPVVALVERGGRARARVVADVTSVSLKAAVRQHAERTADIVTDENAAYRGLSFEFKSHNVVKHTKGEYVRGDVYTNTVESYFALLKRGVTGTFHRISVKHLPRYCDEFSFRWSNKDVSDGVRMDRALRQAEGKRLTYK